MSAAFDWSSAEAATVFTLRCTVENDSTVRTSVTEAVTAAGATRSDGVGRGEDSRVAIAASIAAVRRADHP